MRRLVKNRFKIIFHKLSFNYLHFYILISIIMTHLTVGTEKLLPKKNVKTQGSSSHFKQFGNV